MSVIQEKELALPNQEQKDQELRQLGTLLDESLRRAQARFQGQEKPISIPWDDMKNQFGGGIWPGVHVLVGGTGSGKTAWALQLALHAAKNHFPVGYIGLELEDMQIAIRILAEEASIPWSNLYLGKTDISQLKKAHEAKSTLANLPIYIETGRPSGWPVSELGSFIEKMRKLHPEPNGEGSLPMLLVLDFLQIVGDDQSQGGRSLEIRERIGRAAYFARDAARRYNVAVLLISSAARDKYGILTGKAEEAGLVFEESGSKDSGLPRRKVLKPDMLIGLGKESGEIEYAADSVTVAIRAQEQTEGNESVLFVTAKGRAMGPSWTELLFNGYRFAESPDKGRLAAKQIQSNNKVTPRSNNRSRNGNEYDSYG